MNQVDESIHNFENFKMVLDKNDVDISKQIRDNGWYTDEKLETDVFRSHLKKGMTFLDLGANIGFYTLFGRSIIGLSGKIFAFEPHPSNTKLIKSSIKHNSFENITVVEAAVSNFEGNTTLNVYPDDNSEHSLVNLDGHFAPETIKTIQVDVITIDSFLETKVGSLNVDFIKMDIEGSEFNALKGMKNVLNENKHLILMSEFWPNGLIQGGSDPKKFLDVLQDNHFIINLIDHLKEDVCPIEAEDLLSLIEERSKVLTDEFMKEWGWYTNLICIK